MAQDYTNNRLVYQMLLSKGVPPSVAAGAVGSLVGESGHRLNPNALNPGDGADGSDSIGMYQANGKRAQLIHQTAAAMGTTWNDPRAQVAAMSKELDTSHRHVLAGLRAGTSIEDGNRVWTQQFEVPKNAVAKTAERLPAGYQMARVLGGGDPDQTGAATGPVVRGSGIPETNVQPGLLGFGATPLATPMPGATAQEPSWAGVEGKVEATPATADEAGITTGIVPAGLGGFDASGAVGQTDAGKTLDQTGGLLGTVPGTPSPAFDPAVTGGPSPQVAANRTGQISAPGGPNKTTAALQQAAQGLMRLGALGARGPLHYAPPASGGSPVNRPDVQTPDIYKNQGWILPKINVRGLLG